MAGLTVTYRFFDELGGEVAFVDDGQERPVVLPLPEGQGFDTALEWFWTDGSNDYYFPAIISEYLQVQYPDGSQRPFPEALAAGDVGLADLAAAGIGYETQPLTRLTAQVTEVRADGLALQVLSGELQGRTVLARYPLSPEGSRLSLDSFRAGDTVLVTWPGETESGDDIPVLRGRTQVEIFQP